MGARKRKLKVGGRFIREFARDFALGFVEDRPQSVMMDSAMDVAPGLARDFAQDFAVEVARDLARDFAVEVARDFARDVARYVGRKFARDFARDVALDVALDFGRPVALEVARDFALEVARDFARDFGQDYGRDYALAVARDFAQCTLGALWRACGSPLSESDAVDLAWIEIASLARVAATRGVLATARAKRHTEHHLVSLAARFLRQGRPASSIQKGPRCVVRRCPLAKHYARHIARRSTVDDRALLESLAADPSQRPEPLASALKYYVRGDLVMPDGSELTLDALCDRAGVARLPLLEEMPPELDVDFDAK